MIIDIIPVVNSAIASPAIVETMVPITPDSMHLPYVHRHFLTGDPRSSVNMVRINVTVNSTVSARPNDIHNSTAV